MLYHTLVLPIFEYCDFIFNCLSQKNCIMLERLQNTCLRNIIGYDRLGSATRMRAELEQDSLSLRCCAHSLNEMYKILNDIAPTTLQDLFKVKSVNTE